MLIWLNFTLLLLRWLTATGAESYTKCWDHPVLCDIPLSFFFILFPHLCVSQSLLPFLRYSICRWASSFTVMVVRAGSGQLCVFVCVYIIDSLWAPPGSNLCAEMSLAVCCQASLPDNPGLSWLDAVRSLVRNSWWCRLRSHYWSGGWCHLTWGLWLIKLTQTTQIQLLFFGDLIWAEMMWQELSVNKKIKKNKYIYIYVKLKIEGFYFKRWDEQWDEVELDEINYLEMVRRKETKWGKDDMRQNKNYETRHVEQWDEMEE